MVSVPFAVAALVKVPRRSEGLAEGVGPRLKRVKNTVGVGVPAYVRHPRAEVVGQGNAADGVGAVVRLRVGAGDSEGCSAATGAGRLSQGGVRVPDRDGAPGCLRRLREVVDGAGAGGIGGCS